LSAVKTAYKKAEQPHTHIPNTLNREFSQERHNQVWCGDVTYILIGNRWAYLAVVMDLFSRKPVDLAVSRLPDSELTVKALRMAFELRGRLQGVMFHSDQCCHYTSHKFRQTLWRLCIKKSTGRRGNYWDNAPMEHFLEA
jgi:putative transposase